MITLFRSMVLCRLDYGCQLWSPSKLSNVKELESIQRAFTKRIDGMGNMSYGERLKALNIYSHQRRRDRYCAIYIWKILEGQVPNLSEKIESTTSERRGRHCSIKHVPAGHLGTLCHQSFRWYSTLFLNISGTNCPVSIFKSHLDKFLQNITDIPCVPHEDNSLSGRLAGVYTVLAQRNNQASSESTQGNQDVYEHS